MNRSQALELLRESKSTLLGRYGVTRLALFGSTARDLARDDSDVDVLVALEGPATSQRYFGVQFYLERFARTSCGFGYGEGAASRVAGVRRERSRRCLTPAVARGASISTT